MGGISEGERNRSICERDDQKGYHYQWVIRIPDPLRRYDCVRSGGFFICPRCTTTWAAPVETATYVYFCHVRAKVAAHHTALKHFRYDEVSTPFISRAILLHEEASTKLTSGFETGCVFVDRSLSAAYIEQTGHWSRRVSISFCLSPTEEQ